MRNGWAYIHGTDSKWYQLWRYNEETKRLVNQNGKVLSIHNNDDSEGKYLTTDNNKDGDVKQQRWTITYLDTKGPAKTNGTNENRGFDINRPF
jgi:hypothetical protein